jgi:hypothetical protein
VDLRRPCGGINSRQSTIEPIDVLLLGDGTAAFIPCTVSDDVSVDVIAEAWDLSHVGDVGVVAVFSKGVEVLSLSYNRKTRLEHGKGVRG